jgi:hypothetical protein
VPAWPDTLPAATAFGAPRGFTATRVILHVHSVYSHDACDGEPQDEAERVDEACLGRFRRALCAANVGAAFLTEHDRYLVRADSLGEALLLRPGDTPLFVESRLAANQLVCASGDGPILFAGAENALMPVGFDSLPGGTREERRAFYDADTAGAVQVYHDYGAVVLLSHPEDMPLARISALAPDGIEVYNPHANFAPKHRKSQGLSRLGAIWKILPFYLRMTSAHPDLALLPMFYANRNVIRKWDTLLGRRMVFGFGASDAHENALPWLFPDGDRGDSYFRMIPWVTNVFLLEGAADAGTAAGRSIAPAQDSGARIAAIEDALRRGRFYVAIEAWGTPADFDFHLEGPAGIAEMGETVPLARGQRLVVSPPRVQGLAPALSAPRNRMRLSRIDGSGARSIVVESPGPIAAPVTRPGTYRVEVGIVPRHLTPYLGADAEEYLREVVWIYSNPIRVAGLSAPGRPSVR